MKKSTKSRSVVPFDFVLEKLSSRSPEIRPMFGCYAVYVEDKIVLILRDRSDHATDNGVWIATTQEHHAGLKTAFPHMRSIQLLGGKVTGWQNLPSLAPDFEESVIEACELILRNDPRIGKVPKKKKKGIVRKR